MLSLLGGQDQPIRSYVVSCSSQGLPSIRGGDWKLILGPGSGGWAIGSKDEPIQLYNLRADLGEMQNLAQTQRSKVHQLQFALESMIQNGRSTPGKAQKNDVTEVRYPK
ncbi:MAG: hypothetical protein CMI18_08710 [Opitutaceae bacterium]|nr:hypothetical protein [Opitutaceae bacterium]